MNAFSPPPCPPSLRCGPKSRAAFTLIELLAVIAIIGVLATLTMVATSRVRASAQNTRCTSNLRHIGIALQLYLNEHANLYPGPLYTVQGHVFSGDADGTTGTITLARRLSPYMSALVKTGTQTRNLGFLCPSWESAMDGVANANYPYMVNLDPKRPDGTKWNNTRQPFGDANNASKLPSRASEFFNQPLAQTWMLTELDRGNSSRADPMPDKPVHGTHRNQLFYDYHVAPAAVQ
jgi:prepilin-type N-terminal cleavage/methylation domain-containing protein